LDNILLKRDDGQKDLRGGTQEEMSQHNEGTVKVKPLAFRYQFAAGAVAGISEVSVYNMCI
jgi:hypothetical protein